jgi:hypothetical protein
MTRSEIENSSAFENVIIIVIAHETLETKSRTFVSDLFIIVKQEFLEHFIRREIKANRVS